MPLIGRVCKVGVWDETIPGIEFDEFGVSNYAKLYYKLSEAYPRKKKGLEDWNGIVQEIKRNSTGKYNCVIGVSGGTDSCYLLHIAKELGLKPLAVHLDNGWNTEIAVSNIEKMTKKLDIDLITYVVNYEEIKDLLKSYMKAGMPWIDLPTDIAIKSVLYKVADKYKIKYLLRGNDFRTEGSQPNEWTYGDGRQLLDIHSRYGSVRLKTFPNYTLSNLIYYGVFKKIKSVYPFYYIEYNKSHAKEFLKQNYGWEYYGGHHHENIFTKFAISYWMYKKFGIDKRKITFSALILNNEMSRAEAITQLANTPYNENEVNEMLEYVAKKLDLTSTELESIINNENRNYNDYKSYDYLLQYLTKIAAPFLKLIFIHKPQSLFQNEMRRKK